MASKSSKKLWTSLDECDPAKLDFTPGEKVRNAHDARLAHEMREVIRLGVEASKPRACTTGFRCSECLAFATALPVIHSSKCAAGKFLAAATPFLEA